VRAGGRAEGRAEQRQPLDGWQAQLAKPAPRWWLQRRDERSEQRLAADPCAPGGAGAPQLGLNPVPCVAEHPVSEAVFNFVNAWSLMFWPVMLADPQGHKVKNRLPIWVGTQVGQAGPPLLPALALFAQGQPGPRRQRHQAQRQPRRSPSVAVLP
jgi:hypothetical protein